MEIQESATTLPTCSHCNAPNTTSQKYCESCGFPEGGTETEKAHFHAHRVIDHSKTSEAPRLIKKARNTLFVIAAISLLYGLFVFFVHDDMGSLITSAILAIIYLVLGFWSQQRPLIALVLGLLVYLTVIVINGIALPETLAKGLILKGVIIFFLVKGINSALHLRKSQRA